jgi:hypothetical protein
MSDPSGRIGGSFAERLTQLCESVRESGSQETLETVRRLGRELGHEGVDSFVGGFRSLADEDRDFLKNLFAGQVADADADAAGAKSLFTRELEGHLRHRRLEAHVQHAAGSPHLVAATERLGINPQPEPPGSAEIPHLVSPAERLGINPQPEPPGDFIPREAAAARAAHRLDVESEKRALGPQPEPPDNLIRAEGDSPGQIAPKLPAELAKRHFDPQPEPPGIETPQKLE